MAWTGSLTEQVLQEFVDSARMRGTHLVSRDERPARVELGPFIPASAESVDVEQVSEQAEAGTEVQPEDPPELPRRRVVVDLAPVRPRTLSRVNEPWWWTRRNR